MVVDCRPFQGWFWNGTRVRNPEIQVGDILQITTARDGVETTLKYPVEQIEERATKEKEPRLGDLEKVLIEELKEKGET